MDATINDYVRFCRARHSCMEYPIQKMSLCVVSEKDISDIDDANKKILDWCKTHPVKTRQSKLLKIIPTARIDEYGVAKCKPCEIDDNITCNGRYCTQCRKEYWSEEVEENV